MNVKKTLAATVAVATLGVGGLMAGVANAAPTTTQNPAAAVTSPVTGHQSRRHQVRRAIVVISAKTIGITPQDLVTQLKAGSSIAQVATAHQVDPSTVVTALVNAGSQRIDQAVASGKLSAERGAALKARLPKLALRAVNFRVSPK